MSTSTPDWAAGWGALADSSEEDRQTQMGKQYEAIAQLDEDQRCAALKKMADVEYQLPDDKLRIFTATRLLTWLGMDLEQARTIANSYDQVMKELPAPLAMKRVGMVQTVVRDFDLDQVEQLRELIPSLMREVPRAIPVSSTPSPESRPVVAEQKSSKSSWQFWKRK